ncbi:MAG: histidine phosphatase family protein [Acidimicrobiales bacterium]
MARLHLVRHGRASAGFDTDRDPGLDDTGRAEAAALVDRLGPVGPLPVRVSPLRRCRETAAPLEAAWGVVAEVDPAIAEVVAPTDDLAGRAEWLRRAMQGRWADVEERPRRWRDDLLTAVASMRSDAVLVTHFVVINAVIGAATGDDRVLVERVANGSATVIDVDDQGALHLVAGGAVGESEVL